MCQLIAKAEGKILSEAVLKACWEKNPDGAGFCWSDGNHLHLEKGFMNFEAFYEAYKLHGSKMALIHFRVATHGKKCPANTHPFEVAPDCVVGHNGVLRSFIPLKSDERSDTRYFAETFAAPFFKALMEWECLKDKTDYLGFVPVVAWMMEPLIDFSKLVWMTPSKFYFTGASRGSWADKVWFSSGVATETWYYNPTPIKSLAHAFGLQYTQPKTPEEERDFDGGYWLHEKDPNGSHHRQWIGDKVGMLWNWKTATNIPRDEWMRMPGHYNKYDALVKAGLIVPHATGTSRKTEVIDLQAVEVKDDDLVDAAIRNGTTGGKSLTTNDMHMVYMMQKHDELNAGEITNAEWQAALADMRPSEFAQFVRLFAEGDEDEKGMLESEREHGLTIKAGKSNQGLTLPPWLNRELAKGDKCRPRVFLVGGRLLSRTAAQEVLMTASPLPKTEGFWKPIYRDNGVVKGWESCADDSMIKEAIARGRKSEISHEPTAIL